MITESIVKLKSQKSFLIITKPQLHQRIAKSKYSSVLRSRKVHQMNSHNPEAANVENKKNCMVENIPWEKNKTFSVTINTYYQTVPFSNIINL